MKVQIGNSKVLSPKRTFSATAKVLLKSNPIRLWGQYSILGSELQLILLLKRKAPTYTLNSSWSSLYTRTSKGICCAISSNHSSPKVLNKTPKTPPMNMQSKIPKDFRRRTRSLKFFPPDGGLGLMPVFLERPCGFSDLAGHVGNMAGSMGRGGSLSKYSWYSPSWHVMRFGGL